VYLPILQAKADGNSFVLNVAGAANANESGAGGGLSGANLVFTQNGGIPGVSSGHRALGSGKYFTCTAAFAANFFNLAEFSYFVEFQGHTPALNNMLWNLMAGTTGALWPQAASLAGAYDLYTPFGAISTPSVIPNTADSIWAGAWLKGGVLHFGWKQSDSIPWGWDDIPIGQKVCVGGVTTMSGTWSTLRAVGDATYSPTLNIGTIVASKLGLQAAPL
jgi:hypothetical protein